VEEIIHEATRFLILAHLSQTNNSPELARQEALRSASRAGASQLKIIVSSQNEISELIEI
jgi:hypothetical protein